MDIYKKLKIDPKSFKPGDLLKARAKMTASYLEAEKRENYSKMTAKEKAHERKESKLHEIAEHLTGAEVKALKKLVQKNMPTETKVKYMGLI